MSKLETIPLFLINPHSGYDAHKHLINFMECVSEISIASMNPQYIGNYPLNPNDTTRKWGYNLLFGRIAIQDIRIYLLAKSGNQRLDVVLQAFQRDYRRPMAGYLILPSGKYLLKVPDPPPTASKSKWNPPEREPDRKWEVCQDIRELTENVPDARYVVGYSPSVSLASDTDVRVMFGLSSQIPVISYNMTQQSVLASVREVLRIAEPTPVIQRAIEYLTS